MVTKHLLAVCTTHENCTMKMGFVEVGDGSYDMARDLKPVPQAYQDNADDVFGAVYCVEIEHIDGSLKVEVAQ